MALSKLLLLVSVVDSLMSGVLVSFSRIARMKFASLVQVLRLILTLCMLGKFCLLFYL